MLARVGHGLAVRLRPIAVRKVCAAAASSDVRSTVLQLATEHDVTPSDLNASLAHKFEASATQNEPAHNLALPDLSLV